MKKTLFQIVLAAMIVLVGCSKDELPTETDNFNLLKKGSTNAGISSADFIGNSIKPVNEGDFFFLTGLEDGSKILRKGICSGNLTGYGKINTSLSGYEFTVCEAVANKSYGVVYENSINRSRQFNYNMWGKGRVGLTVNDYFEFNVSNALLVPFNYEAGFFQTGDPEFHGALFGCPLNGQGDAIITSGAGKFRNSIGKTLEIFNNGNGKAIDRTTGVMSLHFRIR